MPAAEPVAPTPPSAPPLLRIGLILLAVVAGLLALWYLLQAWLLIFAGVVLAVALDGLTRLLGKVSPLPRWANLAIVVLTVLTLSALLAMWVGPAIADQADDLAEQLPEALDQVQEQVGQYRWAQPMLPEDLDQRRLADMARQAMGSLGGMLSAALGLVTALVVIVIVGVYGAISPKLHIDPALRLLPEARRETAREVVASIGFSLRRWLIGRAASMVVVGVLTYIGLLVLGVPLALVLAILAAVISFIPNVGPVLALIPAVLVALLDRPTLALWVIGLYMAVQAVESYLITPLIQKRAVDLPPAFLISIQLVMGMIGGVMGLLLAAPLAVVLIVPIQLLYLRDRLGQRVSILGDHDSETGPEASG
jgi:predicted PurR-regulated permease PerM